MKQALDNVRNDLGADAVIFSSRTIKNSSNNSEGTCDFNRVEVTAAIERQQVSAKESVSNKKPDLSNSICKSILTGKTKVVQDGFPRFLIDQFNNNKGPDDIFSSQYLPAFDSLIKAGFNHQFASYLIAENMQGCHNIQANKEICLETPHGVPVQFS